jgi:hypothetical protein
MKLTISTGNVKLGKIANVSLPPVQSCRPGVLCAGKCYAKKSYRMYPNVRNAWDGNLELYRNNRFEYFFGISKWLETHRAEFFRWHVSGEIQDEFYWEAMKTIAESFNCTKFLVFTKMYDLDFSEIPDNLSVVLSTWPGMELPDNNFLPRAWCQDGTETRIPEDALGCPGNCTTCGMCFNLNKIKKDVFFNIH